MKWSTWPWVKMAVWSAWRENDRTSSFVGAARKKLPVSTRTSPSRVSIAETFAKLETKATPGAISSTTSPGVNG